MQAAQPVALAPAQAPEFSLWGPLPSLFSVVEMGNSNHEMVVVLPVERVDRDFRMAPGTVGQPQAR